MSQDKNQDQLEEYRAELQAQKAKAPLLQNTGLIDKLEAGIEQLKEEILMTENAKARAAAVTDNSTEIAELYSDFGDVIRPLKIYAEKLGELNDDVLVTLMMHLEDAELYINAHKSRG